MKPSVTKDYLKLLIKNSVQNVIDVLCAYPNTEFSLSDLAKEARVAKSHIGAILDSLHKIGFIEIAKLSKIWRIKANQKSLIFIRTKIIYNLNLIYKSGLIEFLNEYFKNPKAIVLFGSFRSGYDLIFSDVDLGIETDGTKEYEILNLRELSEFEKIIHRKIQIHLFNRKNVDINVFNNIANGIVLSGFLEVKP